MYGLFENFFDWYHFYNLIAVSESRAELVHKAKELNEYDLLEGDEAKEALASKKDHYSIEEVEVI